MAVADPRWGPARMERRGLWNMSLARLVGDTERRSESTDGQEGAYSERRLGGGASGRGARGGRRGWSLQGGGASG